MLFKAVRRAALKADADGETLVMGFKFGLVVTDQAILKPEGDFLRLHYVEDLQAQLPASRLLDEARFVKHGYQQLVPASPFSRYFEEATCH